MSNNSDNGLSNEEILLQRLETLAHNYKNKEGSLIQVLHMAQGVFGYLPLKVQETIASAMGLPLSTVSGVVSFYSFFATEPRGKHTIRVCLGTACYVRGGVSIVNELEKLLNIRLGHTTADGQFTFEVARCIGACGLAPAMTIDNTVYREVKPEQLPEIIASWTEQPTAQGGF